MKYFGFKYFGSCARGADLGLKSIFPVTSLCLPLRIPALVSSINVKSTLKQGLS